MRAVLPSIPRLENPIVDRQLVQQVCKLPNDSLGMSPDRVYLKLADLDASTCGWNRQHLRLVAMDLPEANGTYVLVASVGRMKRLDNGRLGVFGIVPVFYAYVDSALRSTPQAHRSPPGINCQPPIGHINHLLGGAKPVEVPYHDGHPPRKRKDTAPWTQVELQYAEHVVSNFIALPPPTRAPSFQLYCL